MDKHATAKHTDDKHHVLGKHTAFKLERPHPTDVGWGFYGLAPVKPR